MITDANDFVRDPYSSSGPKTEEGKSRSSRNSLKFGLFTAHDFIRDGEEDEYADTFTSLMSDLAPDNTAEETFVLEIIGATWRLRRCRLVEESFGGLENLDLDPMIDERTEKQQKSVDRARAQSHLILRRSLAELRRLQKARNADDGMNAEPVKKLYALSWCPSKGAPPTDTFYPDGTHVDHTAPQPETTPPAASSFCEEPRQTPRNAPCPCGSGAKYKRCHGKDAPPVLNRAA